METNLIPKDKLLALCGGNEPHRSDFTQEMLPPVSDGLPWRPLLKDEMIVEDVDCIRHPSDLAFYLVHNACGQNANEADHGKAFCRTRRPLPLPTPDSGEKCPTCGAQVRKWNRETCCDKWHDKSSDLPTPTGEAAAEWPDVIGAGMGLGPEPATVKEAIRMVEENPKCKTCGGYGVIKPEMSDFKPCPECKPEKPLAGSAGEAAFMRYMNSQVGWKHDGPDVDKLRWECAAQAAIAHSATAQGERLPENWREAFAQWWSGYCLDPTWAYSADEKEDHMREAFQGGMEYAREQNPQPPAEQGGGSAKRMREAYDEMAKACWAALVKAGDWQARAEALQAGGERFFACLTNADFEDATAEFENLLNDPLPSSPTVAGSGASARAIAEEFGKYIGTDDGNYARQIEDDLQAKIETLLNKTQVKSFQDGQAAMAIMQNRAMDSVIAEKREEFRKKLDEQKTRADKADEKLNAIKEILAREPNAL